MQVGHSPRPRAGRSNPCRNGFDARSCPIVVVGPCPGSTYGAVVAGEQLVAQAAHHLLRVAARQVRAPDRPREQRVAGEDHLGALVCGGAEHDRPRRVARGVVDAQGEPGEVDRGAVVEGPDLARLAHLQPAAEERERVARHPLQRVGEHRPVVGVDERRHVVPVAHRRDGERVVEVAVGEQHRDGGEPVLGEQRLQGLDCVLAGVDHDARLPRSGSQHVAVGLEGPCGESGDEHRSRLDIPPVDLRLAPLRR